MSVKELLLSWSEDRDKSLLNKISAVCADSRKALLGSVFVALKGQKTDGHRYLDMAVEKGAQALIVQRPYKNKSFKGLVCVVPDTRKALPVLLNKFYDYPSQKLFCVGVTGTNGKTTVSSMLSFILSRCGWRTGLIGTLNNSFEQYIEKTALTTPDPVELYALLNCFYQNGAQAVVMEVSSIGLDQNRTAGVDFNLGVFTNLTEDHLDYHKSTQAYYQAKQKLFQAPALSTSPEGKNHFTAVLNFDDPYGVRLAREIKTPYVSYGQKTARVLYKVCSADIFSTEFNICFDNKTLKVKLPISGVYNVGNAVAALCCAHLAGFSMEKAVKALQHFPGVPGRMQAVCPHHRPLVFVDYAHNPQALLHTTMFLRRYCARAPLPDKKNTDMESPNMQTESSSAQAQSSARLITVFGCGGERDREKRPLMAQSAEECSDKIILTSDNPRGEDPMDIINDCLKGAKDKQKFIVEPDREQAICLALKTARKQDMVLIAGKGHEEEQIIGSERRAFSDSAVVKKFFKVN